MEDGEEAVEGEVGGCCLELVVGEFEENGTGLFVRPLHRLNYNPSHHLPIATPKDMQGYNELLLGGSLVMQG